jgi:hypothetical protein
VLSFRFEAREALAVKRRDFITLVVGAAAARAADRADAKRGRAESELYRL